MTSYQDRVDDLYNEIDELKEDKATLLKALEAMIASSKAIAHAAPTALDSLPNARQLHLADVASREQAVAAIKAAKGDA